MDSLKLIDRTFSHSILGYCSDYQTSDLFNWDRNVNPLTNEAIVFTDMVLRNTNNNNKNYAWLIEPVDIAPNNYELIKSIEGNFLKIFTHEKTLLDLGDKYEFVPFGCSWIKPEDQILYSKSKNISIIASNKKQTYGHILRHNVINSFDSDIDVFGRGWNPLEYKLDGLKDYRFSIVIENCKRDYWFTEKLIDCLVTGTVPIYWGCPSIGDFFDTRGFIIFDSIEELKTKLYLLDVNKYNEMLPYIKSNLEEAKKYLLPDEWVFKKIKNG